MKHLSIIISLACLLGFTTLSAEIQQVMISWEKDLCNENCAATFKQKLQSIPGVASVNISVSSSQAVLKWKPEKRFSYKDLNIASRAVGVNIREWVVRLRGSISKSGKNFYINSIGDGSKFQLLSLPPPPPDTLYLQYNNIASYSLNQELQDAFLKAIKERKLVTLSGYLYQPWRGYMAMIVQNYRVEDAKK